MDKGQVSLAVIIGIVVLLSAVFLIYGKKVFLASETEKLSDLSVDSKQLQQAFGLCMDSISYEELSKNIARFGGFTQDELNNKPSFKRDFIKKEFYDRNAVMIGDYYVAIWNLADKDISPDIEDIEIKLSESLSEKVMTCFSETYHNELRFIDARDEKIIKAEFFDDHFEARSVAPLKIEYMGEEFSVPPTFSRYNYNIKKDFEIAKKILADALLKQPQYYDITLNCNDYRTNGKTNIYSIEEIATKDEHVSVISIIDYEPSMRDKKDAFRINFALKNVNVMGYCSG